MQPPDTAPSEILRMAQYHRNIVHLIQVGVANSTQPHKPTFYLLTSLNPWARTRGKAGGMVPVTIV